MQKTFKRILAIMLVVVMTIGAAPLSGFVGLELPEFGEFKKLADFVSEFFDGFVTKAEAATEYTSGYYTYTVDKNEKATIVDVDTSISGNVVVPSIIDGYVVSQIGDFAFEKCSLITELFLPDSLIQIGYSAFKGCDSIVSLTIPFLGENISSNDKNGVLGYIFGYSETEEDGAIEQYKDWALNKWIQYYYYIPQTLRSVTVTQDPTISTNAFYNCSFLTEINIPSAESIGSSAFSNCSGLVEYAIPETVTLINSSAFEKCSNLVSVTIPDTVSEISQYAFKDCSNLETVYLPSKLESIGQYAFDNCSNLSVLHISETVTSIGRSVFYNCDKLTVLGYAGSFAELYCNENNIRFYAYESIKSIYVSTPPTCKQYVGKPVATEGMEISLVFNDLSEVIVSDGFSSEEKTWNESGIQFFTVEYRNLTALCDINVIGINKISLVSIPEKTVYISGETLDCTGLKLKAFYLDGTVCEIENGYIVNRNVLTEIGEQSVSVSYYGSETHYSILVSPISVSHVSIDSLPTITEYFVNDEIDTTGLVLNVIYNNGCQEKVTDGFVVLTSLDNEKVSSVGIDYAGFLVSYPITVKPVYATNLVLSSKPSKLLYKVGEKIDTTGLVLTEYYNNNSNKVIIEGYKCSPEVFDETGEIVVTVSYNGHNVQFAVNVIHIHDYGEGEITVQPTCTKEGIKIFSCDCGDTYTEAVSKLEHDIIIDEAVEATCTKTGLLAGQHCSQCDEATIKQEETPSLGHDIIIDEAVVSTCTKTGLSEGMHCSRCDEMTVEQEIVPVKKHNYIINKYDSKKHWEECVCGSKSDMQNHVFDADSLCSCGYMRIVESTIFIMNNVGTKTINYGETLRLTAITTDMTEDAKIYWYVNGNKVGEGETFDVTLSKGSVEVTVKLVDANGNALKNVNGEEILDSETVSVNSSFWQKIVSFFKNLFGFDRTVVQAIFRNVL